MMACGGKGREDGMYIGEMMGVVGLRLTWIIPFKEAAEGCVLYGGEDESVMRGTWLHNACM